MIQVNTTSADMAKYTENVKIALKNGCQWIQLRLSETSDAEFVNVASSIKELCDEYHAYLIIEDHVHLVKQVKANGVHLSNETNIPAARKALGARYLICVDANSSKDARRCYAMGADCTNGDELGYKMFEMEVSGSQELAYA